MKITHYLSFIKKIDWLLLLPVILLILFGLATLYSSTLNVVNPDLTLFNKQLVFFIIGCVLLLIFTWIDYRRLTAYSIFLYILSILLLIAVLLWGQAIRGTKGWFNILGFGLQPVEFAKFALILALAYFYTKRKNQPTHWLTILLLTTIVLIPAALAILQPDFGAAAVIVGIGLGFFVLINARNKHLIWILIGLILLSILLWNFLLLDYQKDRFLTFVNPRYDPLGQGYNVRQSIIAIGSGQLTGRGLGLGTQSQLHFLPEITSDFIFASIAESLGFLGATLIIIFFIMLFIKLIMLMKKAKDDFSLYLIYGFGLMFFIQAVINISMNIGLFPVAGLSLPFVSYGGSFLLICMLAVGIIQSISLRQKVV